jgi:hypothetical protein
MYINSKVSNYLSHISKQYETRIGYIYLNTPLKDNTLNITSPITLGPIKTLL